MDARRDVGLRRLHLPAISLIRVSTDADAGTAVDLTVEFRLATPDARASFALAVFFVPDGEAAGRDPSWSAWNGAFAEGAQGLSIQGRESALAEGGRMLPVDNVFGSPSNPVPLPGDTYGWLVSGRADAREWRGRLKFVADSILAGLRGEWVAVATVTDDTGAMTEAEWRRVADRACLDGQSEVAVLGVYAPG